MFAHVAAIACFLAAFPADDAVRGKGLVAVALPPNVTPAMKESLSRLKGEALSVGFEVRFIQTETPEAPLAQLEMLTQGLGPTAVVAFAAQATQEGAPGRQLDVWFLDRATGKTSVARLQTFPDEEDRAEVILAVRAVDFIRARMFDSLAQRQSEPPPKPPAPGRFYAALGVTVLHAFAGFPATFLPALQAGYSPVPWARVEGEVSMYGNQASYSGSEGFIHMEQRFFGVGATFTKSSWRRIRPLASLALGQYYAVADGQPTAGYQGQHIQFYCPAAKVAAGLSLPLPHHTLIAAKVGTLWLATEPRFRSHASEAGQLGRPTYTADITLGIAF